MAVLDRNIGRRRALYSAYLSLPDWNRDLVEILAVAYHPLSRTGIERIVSDAAILYWQDVANQNRKLTYEDITGPLVHAGILVEEHGSIECNGLLSELVCREALRNGRFEQWTDLLCMAALRSSVSRQSQVYDVLSRDFEYGLRASIYLNNTNVLEQIGYWRDWYSISRLHDLYEQMFDNPFDLEWMQEVYPSIRYDALTMLIRSNRTRLLPIDCYLELLQTMVDSLTLSIRDLPEYMECKFLSGKIDDIKDVLLDFNEAVSHECVGRVRCVEGNFQSSLEAFSAAMPEEKKSKKWPSKKLKRIFDKKSVRLRKEYEMFFIIASFATGEKKHIRTALSYINRMQTSRQPWTKLCCEALKCAGLLKLGKIQESTSRRDSVDWTTVRSGNDPTLKLITYMALYWTGWEPIEEDVKALRLLARDANRGGYHWLSTEASVLSERFGGKRSERNAPTRHRHSDCILLVDAIQLRPAWEHSLAALERLGQSKRSGVRHRKPVKNRLVWWVSIAENATTIQPVAQTTLKSGRWSKGRKLPLSKLFGKNKPDFCTLQDLKVCAAIEVEKGPRSRKTYCIDSGKAFQALIGHPLVYRQKNTNVPVEVLPSEPQLQVTSESGTVSVRLVPAMPLQGNVIVSTPTSGQVLVTVFEPKHRELNNALGGRSLSVPETSMKRLTKAVAAVSSLLAVHSDIGVDESDATEVAADSTPRIHLTPNGQGLAAEPLVVPFESKGPSFAPGKGSQVVLAVIDQQRVKTTRDLKLEARRMNRVVASCRVLRDADRDGTIWTVPDPYDCLELVEQLQMMGDEVLVAWPKGETIRISGRATMDRLALKIRKKLDWFGIEGTVELDNGVLVSLRNLIDKAKDSKGRFLPVGDKEFIALGAAFRKRIDDIAGLSEMQGKKGLRFHATRSHAIEAITRDAGAVDADELWARQLRRFREAQQVAAPIPATLRAELRDYQVDGFQWATRLAAWGAGACLADDMGLGKTVQALAVSLRRAPNGPTLVVAPTSVCANWIDEARRFTPTLFPVQFGRGDREGQLKELGAFDLLVCSYGLLSQEIGILSSVAWETVILDEAQAIKNRNTLRSKAAMQLQGDFRMITTGTPIENHLGEVWNLFNFINPGLLGSAKSFATKFAVPIHQHRDIEVRRRLRALLRPFILRRTKAAVLDELPPRTEITQRVQMGSEERSVYEAVRLNAIASIQASDQQAGGKHLQILAELTRLRLACCHPRLVVEDSPIGSSKLAAFLQIAAELKDSGHQALVFSQFVSHLAIVRSSLDKIGITYRYLDGSTSAGARKREVDRFQAGAADLFLISLRAGGQGLNLTAADYVVHLDPWWNPAVEDQASDRAHRIGQTRPVTVYRLVMKNSIEEKIVDLHTTKRDLADSLLEGTDLSGKLSADELLGLIRES